MKNYSVSFTSTLRPTTLADFTKEISSIPSKNNITNWTAKHIVKAQNAYTRGVYDCTVGGVTDGKDVVMFHICPSLEGNQDFSNIETKITEKIDMKSPFLQGLLIGSDDFYSDSKKLFTKFQKFMSKNKISYSMFKGHNRISNNTSVSYKANKDEWLFTNEFIDAQLRNKSDKKTIISKAFDEVVISDQDDFVI